MIRLWLMVFLVVQCLRAEDLSLRLAWGQASKNDFGQILSAQAAIDKTAAEVLGIDGGWRWIDNAGGLPFDVYIKGGIYRYLEKGTYKAEGVQYVQDEDFTEALFYIKGYWQFAFEGQHVRLGVAEGVSYAWGIPIVERIEAVENEDHNSNFLNYLEVSLDFDLGRVVPHPWLDELYIGWVLKHRSGIYGAINSVKRGGSNYNLVAIEKNF